MSQFRRSVAKGLFVAGALAASAVVYAAAPAADTSAPSGTASGDIAQANRLLLTPGAYALNGVNDELRYRTEGVSSSSDAVDTEVASLSSGEMLEGSGTGQYGSGRRRSYGRSRYEDRLHNADGSTKIAFVAGGGINIPVGNTGKYYTPSYDITAGGGYNFSRMFGILGEFHYDHAGVTGGAINYEYNNLVAAGVTTDQLAGFDANSHLLSVTVNPVVTFSDRKNPFGAYVTGGVGYYHKTTNFTLPSVGTGFNGYYYYQYSANVNVDTYGAGGFGANAGFGLTYRLSEFSSERLFIEARYHWAKLNTSNNADFFPFNRRNSEYLPVNVGIRF